MRLNIRMMLVKTGRAHSLLFLVTVFPMTLRWARGNLVWFPRSSHAATFFQMHSPLTTATKPNINQVNVYFSASVCGASNEREKLPKQGLQFVKWLLSKLTEPAASVAGTAAMCPFKRSVTKKNQKKKRIYKGYSILSKWHRTLHVQNKRLLQILVTT